MGTWLSSQFLLLVWCAGRAGAYDHVHHLRFCYDVHLSDSVYPWPNSWFDQPRLQSSGDVCDWLHQEALHTGDGRMKLMVFSERGKTHIPFKTSERVCVEDGITTIRPWRNGVPGGTEREVEEAIANFQEAIKASAQWPVDPRLL